MLTLQRQAPQIRMHACGDCMWSDLILKACEFVFVERQAHAFAGTTPFDGGQDACAPEIRVPDLVLSDEAKEAVRFVGDSSREISSGAQREKIPQAIELERRLIGTHECFYEIVADWIVI